MGFFSSQWAGRIRIFFPVVLCFFSGNWGWAKAPAVLSETGLYDDIVQKTVSSRHRHYSPQYPLWSDGAAKDRWIYLPPGEKIQTGTPDQTSSFEEGNFDYWAFPIGTRFWKEFSFLDPAGKKKRVETRYLEKLPSGDWEYSTYLWNDAETEATLAPSEGVREYFPTADGMKHDIPSNNACLQCHQRGGDPILGFDAIQLSTDRDPNAPHAEPAAPGDMNLETLSRESRLTYVPETIKNGSIPILAKDATARAAMGYLHGNCGSCHSPKGNAAFTYLYFRYPASTPDAESAPVLQTAVDQLPSQFEIPGLANSMRIAKGAPDQSTVLYRMSNRREGAQMPPISTKRVDEAAVKLIRAWILSTTGD